MKSFTKGEENLFCESVHEEKKVKIWYKIYPLSCHGLWIIILFGPTIKL